jgi:hypothetical protein
MVPSLHGKEDCPDCGGKLLYNGQGRVCIRCPYDTSKPPSEKRIPAVSNSIIDPKKGDRWSRSQ